MSLYIRHNLMKGKNSFKETPSSQKQGETRGGNYVARIQVGYEKDGSPRYKYFQSIKERDEYLQNRGKTGESKRKLKTKLTREQKESKAKQDASHGKVEGGKKNKLYVKKKNKEDTKKSISSSAPMFIWRLD